MYQTLLYSHFMYNMYVQCNMNKVSNCTERCYTIVKILPSFFFRRIWNAVRILKLFIVVRVPFNAEILIATLISILYTIHVDCRAYKNIIYCSSFMQFEMITFQKYILAMVRNTDYRFFFLAGNEGASLLYGLIMLNEMVEKSIEVSNARLMF